MKNQTCDSGGTFIPTLVIVSEPLDESGPLIGNEAFTGTGHIMAFAPRSSCSTASLWGGGCPKVPLSAALVSHVDVVVLLQELLQLVVTRRPAPLSQLDQSLEVGLAGGAGHEEDQQRGRLA